MARRRNSLPGGREVRLISAPAFLATKLAAFDDRGDGDYAASHDLEDVIAAVDGRPEIVDEVRMADRRLREHLAQRLSELPRHAAFREALPGFPPPDSAAQARRDLVESRLREAGR